MKQKSMRHDAVPSPPAALARTNKKAMAITRPAALPLRKVASGPSTPSLSGCFRYLGILDI